MSTYTEVKYVDVNIGSDETGDGSENNPFATLAKCISMLTTATPLVHIGTGVYIIRELFNLGVADKHITYIGKKKNTVIEIEVRKYALWTGTADIMDCVIRPTNTLNGTDTIAYTADNKVVKFTNVCFTKSLNLLYPTQAYFCLHNSSQAGGFQSNKTFINCTFYHSLPFSSNALGIVKDSATAYSSLNGTNNITSCRFNSDYRIVDTLGKILSSNSTNGVYSGNNAWVKFLIKMGKDYYNVNKKNYDAISSKYNHLDSVDFDKGFLLNELFLDTYIGGEEVNIVHSPMTSNTTPAPYVVTASSEYNSIYQAWRAFDNSASMNNSWIVGNGLKTGWIQIDLNAPTKVNKFSITSALNTSHSSASPRDFTLQGSNDGVNFINISSYKNQSDWVPGLTKLYVLDSIVEYRYYRLDVSAGNGGNLGITVCELGLFFDPSITEKFKPISKFDNFKIVSNDIISISNIKGIKSSSELISASGDIPVHLTQNIDYFKLLQTDTGNDKIKIAISTDKGLSWKTYNDTNGFVDLNITIPNKMYQDLTISEKEIYNNAKSVIIENGIDINKFNTLDFNLLNSKYIRFAYVLVRPSYSDVVETTQLDWKFDVKGWMHQMKDAEGDMFIYDKHVRFVPSINNAILKITAVR